jgi:hypothetical protein
MTEHKQTTFHNGELVAEDTRSDAAGETNPVEPGNGTGFRVEAKPGALEVNTELRTAVDQHGHTLEFTSRTQATTYADQLSANGGDLRLQAAAPNDPTDVDAYLLADHNPSIKEPATINGDTWTFDVGANLFGTLGEAILTATPKSHALIYFIKQDLNLNDTALDHGLTVDVETDCAITRPGDQSGDRNLWYPDCKLIARDGWNGPHLETYYCEIKTGDASFERAQLETMQALAETERVLKIRVLIDDLPDQYSLRIHEVNP